LLFFESHVEVVDLVADEGLEWKTILADKVKAELVLVQNGQSTND
jgi:hypothetical protein